MTALTFYETSTAADLARESLFVIQDGGFFYVHEDAEHGRDYDRYPLAFLSIPTDPEFGDFVAAQKARNECAAILAAEGVTARLIFG